MRELFLNTDSAESFYLRLDWLPRDRFADSDGRASTLMARNLG